MFVSGRPTDPAHATRRVTHDGRSDEVAVEEPLEIRVDGEPLAVTMRTPGHDEELALGFLYGEGLIDGPREAGPTADLAANTIEVAGPLLRDPGERRFYTTSSCGVCGKGALEQVAVEAPRLERPGPAVARELLADAPGRACASPRSSAAAACTRPGSSTRPASLLLVREDVGRHNAMDKVVGRALLDGLLPLSATASSASAAASRSSSSRRRPSPAAPILVGVGAPSSLAIELAADRGMTLGGFARESAVNVYTGAERVA